jgi:DNA-binding transcriptional MerR regulator
VKQVAELAGVTPRTVRFYHSIGLVPEPPRDGSGYRRYGPKEVIELLRVVRLRGLGIPLPQIAERVSADSSDDASLPEALNALADELDAEIDRLASTRDRLREMARSETPDHPVNALTQALQDKGVLGPADDLRSGEKFAAEVLAALHPGGMPGVLAQASTLFGDPEVMARLGSLRRRLRRLNRRTPDAEVAALAADVAAVLPTGGLDGRLDIGLVAVLLTDRLNPAQQRFVQQLHTHMQGTQRR